MKYRFGLFELDEDAGELRRAGKPVTIQPKPLALLALLIRERDRVVPSNELLETLWQETLVSPASLNRAVSAARRAIDDTGRGEVLRSMSRRGYRFAGDVVVVGRAADSAPSSDPNTSPRETAKLRPNEVSSRSTSQTGVKFVGRRDARARLDRALDSASGGLSAIVLVKGPPGIGKTRLTEVFARDAASKGFRTLVGGCRDRDGVPAFWLWAEILRRLAESSDYRDEIAALAASGQIADLAPALDHYAPEISLPPQFPDPRTRALPADQRRFLFFEAAARTLIACARRQPLLLVLEDLQWAGEPSLRLLEHIAVELSDVPLLIVCSIREEVRERGHPVDRTTALLRRLPRCEDITLRGLSRGEVGEFLTDAINGPAPSDLISELYARTEGVPLFVVEATRLLEERGDLAHPDRIPRNGVTLPARAIDLIERSLVALSPACTSALEIGSVLGREFSLTLLAGVAGLDRAVALERIDEAIRAGVLEESASSAATYRFSHALFQDALYDGLSASARAHHHHRAALRLEHQHAPVLDPILSELAHHHHRSIAVGDPEIAFDFARRAAKSAERLFAFEEAAVHYEQALDALGHCERVDPARRLQILLDLGVAHRFSGDRARRLAVYELALDCARSLDDPWAFARAAIGFCDLSEWSAPDARAPEIVSEAIARADPADLAGRARLTTRLAYLDVRNRPEAEPLGRRAVELARRSGDPEALEESLYTLHYIIAGPDDLTERRTLLEKSIETAKHCANRDTAVIETLDIACDHLMQGDRDGALELRGRAVSLGDPHPSATMRWHLSVWDAGLALLEGRLSEVEQQASDALLLGRRIGHPFAKACYNGQMATLDRDRGAPDRIIERLGHTIDDNRLGVTHWTRAIVGRAEQALGHHERARALLEEMAQDEFKQIARNIRWNGTCVEIAHLCAETGAERHARSLIELLSTAHDQHALLPIPINYGGPISHALGTLHAMLGFSDEAIACFEEALESATVLRARPTVLRIRADLIPLLVRHGKQDRARDVLVGAEAEARALGMLPLGMKLASLALD